VLVSGILAILGSAFAILVSAFTLAALNLIPLPLTAPVTPSYVASIANVSMLIFLGIAVFGTFTGIGLIRLRNWARISILIFSGLTVFFGGTALLVLLAIPFPINPSVWAACGSWRCESCRASGVWHSGSHQHLVARAVQLERNEGAVAGTSSETSPGIPSAPACPLPVQTIAFCFLFSVLWMLVVPFLQMPFPAVFFGHPFYGTSGKVLIVLAGLLLGAASIGLLKLKKWSYPLVLGQGFWLLSGTITISAQISPGLMQEMRSQMHLPENAVFAYSMRQLQLFWSLGLLFKHPDYCNASLLSPALHGCRFRSRGTPTGLASLPILAQPNAHLCAVCHP